MEFILLIVALLIGFYMAWNIGANDVANAIGTSVGSGALTLRRAVILAAVFEFAGALLVGSHVSETVQKGIVRLDFFADVPFDVVYGMVAALLAAGAWLQIASYFGWPVSTTHSIVGAIVGFGLVHGSWRAIYWTKILQIAASWLISPLLGASLAYLAFSVLRRTIFYQSNPLRAAKIATPYIVFCVFTLLGMVGLMKGLANLQLSLSFPKALGLSMFIGCGAALASHFLVQRIPEEPEANDGRAVKNPQVFYSLDKVRKHLGRVQDATSGELREETADILRRVDDLQEEARQLSDLQPPPSNFQQVERIFASLQVISACFMAFAHGANDVANAIGPLAGAIRILHTGDVGAHAPIPLWILALGGTGIIIGLASWGWRVIDTIGKKITQLTPSRGFAAEFGASTTILLASKMGLPISTTHTLVGAVLGVGLARGIGAINLALIRDIIMSWVVTLPAGAMMSIFFFYILKFCFG